MNQLSQRTLAEMKLRLFLNLGLSSESQGNTPVGIEFISKVFLHYLILYELSYFIFQE